MKPGPLLLGVAAVAGIAWLLAPKKAHAASLPAKPTATDADTIIDAGSGEIAPALPPVSRPSVELDADIEKPSVVVGPGKITIPLPGNLNSQPLEPSAGSTMTDQTPGVWDQPDGDQVVGDDPITWTPGSAGQTTPGSIVIDTPTIDMGADSLDGHASIDLPTLDEVIDAAGEVFPGPKTFDPSTVELLQRLLAEEATKGWKKIDEGVRAWQKPRGLTPDGKFGPLTSSALFDEAGMTALVRWWPTSAGKAAALRGYAAAINAAAQKNGTTAAASIVTAREKGQSYGVTSPAAQEVIQWQP